jgi:hypothetical protein
LNWPATCSGSDGGGVLPVTLPPSSRGRPNHSADQERIARLEKKIQTKDEVLAELMADHVALKKSLGNSDRGLGSARHAGPDRGFHPALVGKNEISAGRFIA